MIFLKVPSLISLTGNIRPRLRAMYEGFRPLKFGNIVPMTEIVLRFKRNIEIPWPVADNSVDFSVILPTMKKLFFEHRGTESARVKSAAMKKRACIAEV